MIMYTVFVDHICSCKLEDQAGSYVNAILAPALVKTEYNLEIHTFKFFVQFHFINTLLKELVRGLTDHSENANF